jgi:hypothetical protein
MQETVNLKKLEIIELGWRKKTQREGLVLDLIISGMGMLFCLKAGFPRSNSPQYAPLHPAIDTIQPIIDGEVTKILIECADSIYKLGSLA